MSFYTESSTHLKTGSTYARARTHTHTCAHAHTHTHTHTHTGEDAAIMATKNGFKDLASKLTRLTYLKLRRDQMVEALQTDLDGTASWHTRLRARRNQQAQLLRRKGNATTSVPVEPELPATGAAAGAELAI